MIRDRSSVPFPLGRTRHIHAFALLLTICCLPGCSAFGGNTEIIQPDGQRDADRATRLTQDGVRHLRHGNIPKAQAAFQQAIAVDETHGPAHNNLGLLSFEQRDFYAAAWSFQRAGQYMPERAEPANNLGLTYEAAGRLDEAIAMYYTAHELEPANAQFLGNLTRARTRRGDQDDLLRHELQQLLFIDVRPDWIAWAEDQLVLALRRSSSAAGPRFDQAAEEQAADQQRESLPAPQGASWSISDGPRGGAETQLPPLVPPAAADRNQ